MGFGVPARVTVCRAAAAMLAMAGIALAAPPASGQSSDTIMRDLLRRPGGSVAVPQPRLAPVRVEDRETEAAALLQELSGGNVESFKAALVEAALHHPARLSAVALHAQAQAQLDEAQAAYYPQVDAGISGRSTYRDSAGDDLDGNLQRDGFNEDVDLSVTARQLLFDAGATIDREEAAAAFVRQSRFSESDTAGIQVETAAIAHFRLLAARVEQKLAASLLERMTALRSQVEERYRSGASPVSDVLRAESNLSGARAEQVAAERSVATAIAGYIEAFGAEPARLELPNLAPDLPGTAEEAAAAAAKGSPTVRAAIERRAGRSAQHSAARADHWPRLELQGSAAQLNVNEDGGDFSASVGLQVRWRLFDGGATSARARSAKAALEEASQEESRLRRQAEREARAAFAALSATQRQVSISGRALQAAEQARDAAYEQFRVQGSTLLDVLDAERDAHRASIDWIRARLELSVAQIRLLRESGQLQAWFGPQWPFGNPGQEPNRE